MLSSNLFRGDPLLQDCARLDSAHVTLGTRGNHVSRIHTALLILEGVSVPVAELWAKEYGKSTAAAILKYKTKRHIVNTSYQSVPDNIVGKMTITSLDAELSKIEKTPPVQNLAPRQSFT